MNLKALRAAFRGTPRPKIMTPQPGAVAVFPSMVPARPPPHDVPIFRYVGGMIQLCAWWGHVFSERSPSGDVEYLLHWVSMGNEVKAGLYLEMARQEDVTDIERDHIERLVWTMNGGGAER